MAATASGVEVAQGKQLASASGEFLPFLPSDNSSLVAEEVISTINDDLGRLLRRDAASFWSIVRTDSSLHACIDSYLRYKRRPHDDVKQAVPGVSAAAQQLAKRVFMVILRMCSASERSTGGPSASEQAALLYDRWLLDVPKLMDIAVLYGSNNAALTRQLMHQVFKLQQRYSHDVESMVPLLVANLREVQQRCLDAVGASVASSKEDSSLAPGMLDAAAYLRDVALTLLAFVDSYNPAAPLLVRPSHGSLLEVLASMHDDLLPAIRRAVSSAARTAQKHSQVATHSSASNHGTLVTAAGGQGISNSGSSSSSMLRGQPITAVQVAAVDRQLQQLSLALQCLLFRLLQGTYLLPKDNAKDGPTAVSSARQDSEHLGNELMTLLLSLAHPGGEESDAGIESRLLQDITAHYHLDVAVADAMQQGLVQLDNSQFEYLLAILGSSSAAITAAQQQNCNPAGGSNGSGASSSQGSSGAGPSTSSPSQPPIDAKLALLVAQVKEVLPDYGDGFISACLEAMGRKPEAVLQALLEGSLPQAVAGLDAQLAVWPPPTKVEARSDAPAKGRARGSRSDADDAGASSSSALSNLTWGGLAASAAATAAGSSGRASAAISSVQLPGAAAHAAALARRKGVHKGTARLMGRLDEAGKAATQRLADSLQWEDTYNDEYDDSFDDLSATGNDGVCDVEGEDGNRDAARRFAGTFNEEPDDAAFASSAPSGRPSASSRGLPATARISGSELQVGQRNSAGMSAGQTSSSSVGRGAAVSALAGLSPAQGGVGRAADITDVGGRGGFRSAADAAAAEAQAALSGSEGVPSLPAPDHVKGAGGSSSSNRPLSSQSQQVVRPRAPLQMGAGAGDGGRGSADARGQSPAHAQGQAGQHQQQQRGGQQGLPPRQQQSAQQQPHDGPGRQPQASQQQQGQQRHQGQGSGQQGRGQPQQGSGKQWVLNGRIYNFAKEGATEVHSRQEADAVLEAAHLAAQAIHGLGAGGNKALARQQQAQTAAADRAKRGDEDTAESEGEEGDGGEGGRGQGGGGRGRGRDGGRGGRGGYAHKEANKAAIGNHHRKDRALRKMGL